MFTLFDIVVSVDGETDDDYDLQDIIELLSSNRNKKRAFKPRIPKARNIKQRLNTILHKLY